MTQAVSDTAFVLCVEPGGLEYKSLCLLLTLRRNAGAWKDCPVLAYSPRPQRFVSPWMRECFERYGVTHIQAPLNTAHADYPLANKPICMADAEERRSEAVLVFLDGDIFCWAEPAALTIPSGIDLGLVVDGTKTVASSGPGDRYEPFWQDLYRLTGATQEPYVTTLLTGKRVRGWWSSGVVVCRRRAGLMARWRDSFFRAAQEVHFPPEATYLREQCVLCAVAASAAERLRELPVAYNYPIQNADHYARAGTAPEAAVFWHYQCFMNQAFRHFAARLDRVPTVAEKIAQTEEFVARARTDYRSLLGEDISWVQAWRRKLRLGIRVRKLFGLSRQSDDVADSMSGVK